MIDVFRHLFIFTKLNTLQKKKLFTILQTHKFCKNLKKLSRMEPFFKIRVLHSKITIGSKH